VLDKEVESFHFIRVDQGMVCVCVCVREREREREMTECKFEQVRNKTARRLPC